MIAKMLIGAKSLAFNFNPSKQALSQWSNQFYILIRVWESGPKIYLVMLMGETGPIWILKTQLYFGTQFSDFD